MPDEYGDPAVRAWAKAHDSTSNEDDDSSRQESESQSSHLRTISSAALPPPPPPPPPLHSYPYPEAGKLPLLPNAELARHNSKRQHDVPEQKSPKAQSPKAASTRDSPRRSPKRRSPSTESASAARKSKAVMSAESKFQISSDKIQPDHSDIGTPSSMAVAAHGSAPTSDTPASRQDISPADQPAAVTQTRARSSRHRRPPPDTQMKQPRTLKISQSQLAEEIRGIYAGLAVVEAKCRAMVEAHVRSLKAAASHGTGPHALPATKERWPHLVALHRTLLHEHHDFLLASQHPVASPSMKNLAKRHGMPGRMWRYGIHSFLELMRHHLPESHEFLLEFLLLAYQMMALLYETVPAFADTWLECLGDLSRYRMAIENSDERERSMWATTSRYWYVHARDRSPGTGRVLHHLAVLSRHHTLQQMAFYAGALTTVDPFPAARESIQTLIGPILARPENVPANTLSSDLWYVKALALLLVRQSLSRHRRAARNFLSLLDSHIRRAGDRFRGAYLALTNVAAVLDYGNSTSPVWHAFSEIVQQHKALTESQSTTSNAPETAPKVVSDKPVALILANAQTPPDSNALFFPFACQLLFRTLEIVLRHPDEQQTQPYVHVVLAFLLSVGNLQNGTHFLEPLMPWAGLATYLNALSDPHESTERIEVDAFPQPPDNERQPLLEDYLLQGLVYTTTYFPEGWFNVSSVDQDSRFVEAPSTPLHRAERLRWLGCQLAKLSVHVIPGQTWLRYDGTTRSFNAAKAQDDMDEERKPALWLLGATLDGDMDLPLDVEQDVDGYVNVGIKTEPTDEEARPLSMQSLARTPRYSLDMGEQENVTESKQQQIQDVSMADAEYT